MSLMEDYHPLKGKMFQILKPDGTLQPGMKPPLSDQETFNLYQKMLFIRLADQRALMLQTAGTDGNLCSHLGSGGLPGRKCFCASKRGLGLSCL